jgi:hypothetical protein
MCFRRSREPGELVLEQRREILRRRDRRDGARFNQPAPGFGLGDRLAKASCTLAMTGAGVAAGASRAGI